MVRKQKIFMFGLDRAGKTVVTQYLTKRIIDEKFKPTLSFNQQSLILPKVEATIWDTPGQIKFRKFWLKNVAQSQILIFILDTSDSARFEEAKTELTDFIKGLYNFKAPLIFCYNQIDKPEAQGNLQKAKEFFNLEDIYIQDIYEMETTIKDPKTLDVLRDRINELIIKKDIEEFHIQKERKEKAEEIKKQKKD